MNKFQKGTVVFDNPNCVTINQKDLDSSCWLVQFGGTDACKTCELLNTPDCGGTKEVKEYLKVNF